MTPRPLVLVILDGFGARESIADNAVRLAKTPHLDRLFARFPHTTIATSGPDVGLPPGQMGNSEVGHLNLGTGRVAMMELSRIDQAVFDKSLGHNPAFSALLAEAKRRGGAVHVFGLLSNGGVHSSIEHLIAMIEMAAAHNVPVVAHPFLDGRDVQPGTAPVYLARLEQALVGRGVIGSVSGRFYSMDRDNRWQRVEAAYRAIVAAEGPRFASAAEGYAASVQAGKTDEFVVPFVVGNYVGVERGKDVGLHANFRPDRARELVAALAVPGLTGFDRAASAPSGTFADPPLPLFACTAEYDAAFGLPVAFHKDLFHDTFGEVLARHGLTQFRCAETEKYAHITYFFNGSRETPFPGEERTLVPSPKEVATYDLKPEMSAAAVTDAVTQAIESARFDYVMVNFANPDMVGHTGNLAAAIAAVEAVDTAVGKVAAATFKHGGALIVTADHGNCELMRDPETGAPHTSHTTLPVPFLYAQESDAARPLRAGGRLADVAPTMLAILGLARPDAMSGVSLLEV